MFYRIDEWLIDKFERFSHWTQAWFGLTSATWERCCLLAMLVGLMCKEMPVVWGTPVVWMYWMCVLHCLTRFLASVFRPRTRISATLALNPAKVTDRWARLFGVSVLLLVAYPDLSKGSFWYEFSQLAFYFQACDDLPPGLSKLQTAWRSIEASFRTLAPATNSHRAP